MAYFEREEAETVCVPDVNLRTFGISLACHAALVLVFLGASWVTSIIRPHESIIPIDMTVVPPWAVQDPDDPKPDPNPPPQEQPKPQPQAKPKPEPDPIPEAKENLDAVEKIVEKPKPKKPVKKEFRKAKLEEQKKPVAKKPAKKEFKKATLVDAPPRKVDAPKNLPVGKGTSRDKPLSKAEFEKALAAGARIGSENHLAASEEQRCVSLIQRAFHDNWRDFSWHDGLKPVQLTVQLGPGGRVSNPRVRVSSGDAAVDRSVVLAAQRIGCIAGLSAEFLKRHPQITIEMEPTRE